jgi:hypothetical protein
MKQHQSQIMTADCLDATEETCPEQIQSAHQVRGSPKTVDRKIRQQTERSFLASLHFTSAHGVSFIARGILIDHYRVLFEITPIYEVFCLLHGQIAVSGLALVRFLTPRLLAFALLLCSCGHGRHLGSAQPVLVGHQFSLF